MSFFSTFFFGPMFFPFPILAATCVDEWNYNFMGLGIDYKMKNKKKKKFKSKMRGKSYLSLVRMIMTPFAFFLRAIV